jgi:hypothetical protein
MNMGSSAIVDFGTQGPRPVDDVRRGFLMRDQYSPHALANKARAVWLERGISATPNLGLHASMETFTVFTDEGGDSSPRDFLLAAEPAESDSEIVRTTYFGGG